MITALADSIEIELLVEGERNFLFHKITGGEEPFGKFSGSPKDITFLQVESVHTSDDGKELVFEVNYLNHKIYYYFFVFKELFLLPSLSFQIFGIKDYACLKVSNGFKYFYMFLKGEIDSRLNSFPNLVDDYYFDVPTDERKLLVLNPMNKDTKFLLNESNLVVFKGLMGETSIYCSKGSSAPFERSRVNSNYVFIRKDLKDDLERKYGDLFREFAYRKYCCCSFR